jgi:hypothetical protein
VRKGGYLPNWLVAFSHYSVESLGHIAALWGKALLPYW